MKQNGNRRNNLTNLCKSVAKKSSRPLWLIITSTNKMDDAYAPPKNLFTVYCLPFTCSILNLNLKQFFEPFPRSNAFFAPIERIT